MTSERAFVVGVVPTADVLSLVADIRSAAKRARKADPGDRSDVVRFESLAAQLEHLAATSVTAPRYEVPASSAEQALVLGEDEEYWGALPIESRDAAAQLVQQGLVPVLVIHPLIPGSAPKSHGRSNAAKPPAESWRDPDGYSRRRAVEARFRAQIREALDAQSVGGAPRAIAPSGVQNSVVTEILREFVAEQSDASRVDVPIEYRDGSRSARPFPLRSLKLRTQLQAADLELRLALMSIRHIEMDAVVHGTWLRNAEVSRPRPAGQTDDLVYEISRAQLLELTAGGSRRIRIALFQTGLEAAIVGFYKALVDHLLEFERSVAVQPMFYRNPPRRRDDKRPGRSQATGSQERQDRSGHHHPRTGASPAEFARFWKGSPWQT